MKWQEGDILYLKEKYPSDISTKKIASSLNRSAKAVKHKAARLGLSRQRVPVNKPRDKFHRKEADRKYYLRNRNQIYSKKMKRRRDFKVGLVDILGGKCNSCGYDRCLNALEFHHNSGVKEKAVSELLKNESKQKLLKEAKKCILLCANCHRELHYKGA